MLVIIGRTPESLKERVGLHVGLRESVKGGERCWPDVRRRGRAIRAEITVVLGALGFWKTSKIFCPPSVIGGAGCPRLRTSLDLGLKIRSGRDEGRHSGDLSGTDECGGRSSQQGARRDMRGETRRGGPA